MSERGMSDSDERAKDWELISVTSCSDLDYENFIFPPSLHEGLPIEIDIGNSQLGIEDFENSQLGVEEIRNSQMGVEESRNSQLGFDDLGNLDLDSSSRVLGEGLGENVENEVSECCGLESPKVEDVENKGCEDVDEGCGEGVFGVLDRVKGLGFGCGGVKSLGFGWDEVKGWEGWLRKKVDSFGKPNALWSIAMTATFVGIVFLGHKWQREKWKNQQIRQQLSANEKKISELLCQVARLNDAISGRRKVTVVKNS